MRVHAQHLKSKAIDMSTADMSSISTVTLMNENGFLYRLQLLLPLLDLHLLLRQLAPLPTLIQPLLLPFALQCQD